MLLSIRQYDCTTSIFSAWGKLVGARAGARRAEPRAGAGITIRREETDRRRPRAGAFTAGAGRARYISAPLDTARRRGPQHVLKRVGDALSQLPHAALCYGHNYDVGACVAAGAK